MGVMKNIVKNTRNKRKICKNYSGGVLIFYEKYGKVTIGMHRMYIRKIFKEEKRMSEFKKLIQVKRILAMMLAVAMVVTMLPTTTYAAAVTGVTTGGEDSASTEGLTVETTVDENEPVVLEESGNTNTTPTKDVYTFVDGINEKDKTVTYDGEAKFGNVTSSIIVKKNDTELDSIAEVIKTGGPLDKITTTWQVKSGDGSFVDMEKDKEPINAGEYQLVVKLPEVADKFDEAVVTIGGFTIEKAKLTANVAFNEIEPGKKASELTFNGSFELTGAGKTFHFYLDDASTTDKDESKDSEFTFKQTVKTIAGQEVKDDEELVTTKDYVVEFTDFKFTDKAKAEDAANFEFPEKVSKDVSLKGTIATKVEASIALKDDQGQPKTQFDFTYTGKEVEIKDTDYTAKVLYNTEKKDTEDNDIYEELKDAVVVGKWFDEYQDELDSAPVDAGTYYYVLKYEGKSGVYNESVSDKLKVVISPVELTIKPVIAFDAKFYNGTTAEQVLSKVTDYEVYTKDGQKYAIDTYFWGVYRNAYNGVNVTQPYEPTFKVQVEQKVSRDSAAETTWVDLSSEDMLSKDNNYRVVIDGKKAVYDFNAPYNRKYEQLINNSVNSSNSNYQVIYNDEAYKTNCAALTVEAQTAATITMEAILGNTNGEGTTFDKPITKVYDGKGIYTARKDYKKAVVADNTSNKQIVSGADKSITYQWYTYKDSKEVNGTVVHNYNKSWFDYAPSEAGKYKLVVSYHDVTNQYYADDFTVYYEIEKQIFAIVPEVTTDLVAYTGMTVEEFFDSYQDKISHKVYAVDKDKDGKLTVTEKELPLKDYTFEWVVKPVNTTTNTYGEPLAGDAKFVTGTDYVFVAANVVWFDEDSENWVAYSDNYIDYQAGATADKNEYFHKPQTITLKEMGNKKLEVKKRENKVLEFTKTYDGKTYDLPTDAYAVYEKGTTTEDNVTFGYWEYTYKDEYDDDVIEVVKEPLNAGSYTYYVDFYGNETYQGLEDGPVAVAKVTINKAELTFTPVAKENVVAGTSVSSAADPSKTVIDGYIPSDKAAFACENWSYWSGGNGGAIDEARLKAFDENDSELNYDNTLAGNKNYTLTFASVTLTEKYDRNYKVVKFGEDTFTTVRGNSTVYGQNVEVDDKISAYTHTIVPLEGIPYDYVSKQSNVITIEIRKPSEISDLSDANDFLRYENSLSEAGAFNIRKDTRDIYASFAVTEDNKSTERKFVIRWDEDYTETFILDLSKAVLIDDFTQAVAPKSISLISPSKKMAVGGTQQLDVKLTKVQQNDIIHLSYEADNSGVLHVTENGLVTALKTGTGKVTVTSTKWENGEYVPVKGAKTVSLTIKVSEVTAPKIKKVTALDTTATVQYTKPADGWRVEVYVLEGNQTAATFETKIASMKNGNWQGIFASKPVYGEHALIDAKTKTNELLVNTLQTNKAYTVYVRNVSQVRALSDSAKVSESHAGAVKSFSTTKSQVTDLELVFDSKIAKKVYDDYLEIDKYEVKLSAGSLTLKTNGVFDAFAGDPAADNDDTVTYALPLDKTQQDSYVNPSLVYYVGEPTDYYRGSKGLLATIDLGDGDYGYIYSSSVASATKKGKVSLKGVGDVAVVVLDTNTGEYGAELLTVTATADSITGKSAKLQVGGSMPLYQLLTYKEGKKVLNSYKGNIAITDELKTAIEKDGYFKLEGKSVTAIKAGGKLDITLTDNNIKDKSAKVKLQSTALDPVKNLKASFITDEKIYLQFTHIGTADAFRIEVTDARGRYIECRYVDADDLYDDDDNVYYGYISDLTKKSKYNVTVTALYGDVASKAVKKTFTTTAVPASYDVLYSNEYTGYHNNYQLKYYETCYNDGIDVMTKKYTTISDYTFITGNTYALHASAHNKVAQYSLSDTLTWTSSNKKVATVKANAGSYTATLQAVGTGFTTIELKSKVTKAVIARYVIYVDAVGAAQNRYFGDNEKF